MDIACCHAASTKKQAEIGFSHLLRDRDDEESHSEFTDELLRFGTARQVQPRGYALGVILGTCAAIIGLVGFAACVVQVWQPLRHAAYNSELSDPSSEVVSAAMAAFDVPRTLGGRFEEKGRCVNDPVDWHSAGGVSCEAYGEAELCTPSGGYGKYWDVKIHGTFDDWASGGRTAAQACCACGGGSKIVALRRGPVPKEAGRQRRSSAHLSNATNTSRSNPGSSPGSSSSSSSSVGSASNGFADSSANPPSKDANGHEAPGIFDGMINFGEQGDFSKESQDSPPECSWDFTNCSASKCCKGFGMQCYEKDKIWASCKASCTAGKDPFDVDAKPWSCNKFGRRAPGPGSEETCNRVRVGANFWSGKVFHEGDARTPDTCARECAMKDWCGAWTFRKAPGGPCYMAPPSMRKRRLFTGAAGGKKPCRLASDDLPAWNCSAKGANCFDSRCCQASGSQCYKKEDGYGTCMPSCKASEAWKCEKLGPRFCPPCRPATRQQPAIVIPTFERDLCKAVVLAKSIAQRDPNGYLGDVYLMWVSMEPAWKYAASIDEMRQSITNDGGRQFHLLDFSANLDQLRRHCIVWSKDGSHCNVKMGGWYAQESLKLKIASIVPTDYYLLLDSKNAFVRDVEEDTFFSPCNQARIFGKYRYEDIPPPHNSWYENSASLLGIEADTGMYWPTSITPAMLHKRTVLEMLEQIGEGTNPYSICDGPLCMWFGMEATEFTMYNLFLFAKADRFCSHSFEQPASKETSGVHSTLDEHKKPWGISLWRGSPHVNLEMCESVAQRSVEPLTFGLQAGCLARMENATDAINNRDGARLLLQRTSDCITQVYGRAGLFDGSSSEEGIEDFTACVS